MKTYRAYFTGRKVGSIGIIDSSQSDTVQARDKVQAMRKLYDKYEHISGLKLTEVDPSSIP